MTIFRERPKKAAIKCVVCEINKKRGFTDIDEELKERYLKGERGESGDLALGNYYNTRLLEAIIFEESAKQGKGVFVPVTSMSNLYNSLVRYLGGKETTEAEWTDIENLLNLMCVEIETFMMRFVSNYNVVKHINQCLNVTREPIILTEEDFFLGIGDNLTFADKVLSRIIERMESKGLIEKRAFDYMITVLCTRCARKYPMKQFITPGFKCECEKV